MKSEKRQYFSYKNSASSVDRNNCKSRRSSFVENLVAEYKNEIFSKTSKKSDVKNQKITTKHKCRDKSQFLTNRQNVCSRQSLNIDSKEKPRIANCESKAKREKIIPLQEFNSMESWRSSEISKQYKNPSLHRYNRQIKKAGQSDYKDFEYKSQLLKTILISKNENPGNVLSNTKILCTKSNSIPERESKQLEFLFDKKESSLKEEFNKSKSMFQENYRKCVFLMLAEKYQEALDELLKMRKSNQELKTKCKDPQMTIDSIRRSSIQRQLSIAQFYIIFLYSFIVSFIEKKSHQMKNCDNLIQKLYKSYTNLHEKMKNQNLQEIESLKSCLVTMQMVLQLKKTQNMIDHQGERRENQLDLFSQAIQVNSKFYGQDQKVKGFSETFTQLVAQYSKAIKQIKYLDQNHNNKHDSKQRLFTGKLVQKLVMLYQNLLSFMRQSNEHGGFSVFEQLQNALKLYILYQFDRILWVKTPFDKVVSSIKTGQIIKNMNDSFEPQQDFISEIKGTERHFIVAFRKQIIRYFQDKFQSSIIIKIIIDGSDRREEAHQGEHEMKQHREAFLNRESFLIKLQELQRILFGSFKTQRGRSFKEINFNQKQTEREQLKMTQFQFVSKYPKLFLFYYGILDTQGLMVNYSQRQNDFQLQSSLRLRKIAILENLKDSLLQKKNNEQAFQRISSLEKWVSLQLVKIYHEIGQIEKATTIILHQQNMFWVIECLTNCNFNELKKQSTRTSYIPSNKSNFWQNFIQVYLTANNVYLFYVFWKTLSLSSELNLCQEMGRKSSQCLFLKNICLNILEQKLKCLKLDCNSFQPCRLMLQIYRDVFLQGDILEKGTFQELKTEQVQKARYILAIYFQIQILKQSKSINTEQDWQYKQSFSHQQQPQQSNTSAHSQRFKSPQFDESDFSQEFKTQQWLLKLDYEDWETMKMVAMKMQRPIQSTINYLRNNFESNNIPANKDQSSAFHSMFEKNFNDLKDEFEVLMLQSDI